MVMIDTPEGIEAFRLLAHRSALKLWVNHKIKVTRGPGITGLCQRHYGLKGTGQKLLDQMDALCEAILAPAEPAPDAHLESQYEDRYGSGE